MRRLLKKSLFTFSLFLSLLTSVQLFGQTEKPWNPALNPGGANSMVFKFTKQVWLNPTIILLKQNFEQSTQVKLLLLPRLNGKDTTGSSKLEKAFDKVLSLLVYQDNVQGSIKFYFDPQNPAKPFTFATSEELHCKFTDTQKDTVEQLLNKQLSNATNLNDFTAIPFDSIITQASRYCKGILQSNPGACGPNPAYEFTLKNINSTPAKLNFERLNNSAVSPNGDVDVKKYLQLAQYYNSATDLADNSTYDIAWKALSTSGKGDVIKLKSKKKLPYFDSKKVVFKNTSGTETYNTTFNPADSSLAISISGKPAGSMAEVIGYYTPEIPGVQPYAIGAFNVQFYQEKPSINVVLVDLGGAKMPSVKDVQDELAKVYGGVFVNFEVRVASTGALPSSINKNIHIEKSSLLSNYMPDMKPIINHVKNSSAFKSTDKNTYYLLFGCSNDGQYLGYMPRARNIGFIFDNNPHTIAHELGHGAFNLKHIFSSDELGEGNREQTDNLMDYAPANGSATKPQDALYKHQWDCIHDPSFVGWFEGDDEEGAAKNLKGTYTVYVGDEIMTDKQILINTDQTKKVYINYVPAVGNTETTIEAKIMYRPVGSKTDISWPASTWLKINVNTKTDLGLDTLLEGTYMVLLKDKANTTEKFRFNLRSKKYDIACSVCGRDLSLTLEKLGLIFPGNREISQPYVDYFNDALKRGGFTTCERQGHFFSQIFVETGNFIDFEEDYWYRLTGIFETFGGQTKNDSYKTFYDQNFWDKDLHLNYTSAPKCEYLYQKKDKCTDIKDKSKRYKEVGKKTYTREELTIILPGTFKKDTTGVYVKYTIGNARKCGENLFNLVYENMNGNKDVGDGWKYRGRGAIQTTGRANYRDAAKRCFDVYGKEFDWEAHPDQLNTDKESIIYSAASWFLNAFNPITKLDKKTSREVTTFVNSKGEKASERAEKYKKLIEDDQLFNCELK